MTTSQRADHDLRTDGVPVLRLPRQPYDPLTLRPTRGYLSMPVRTRKTTTPRAARAAKPTVSSYMIKNVERAMWDEFTRRAKAEGRTLAWLFRDFIARYANGT
jgi:hypothetical protein